MSRHAQSPAERVRATGAAAASVPDLLAVGFARREEDAEAGELAARTLLDRFGGLQNMQQLSAAEIKATGLEGFEILRVQALIELGRRIANAGKGPSEPISHAADVARRLDYLRHEKQEHFMVVLLDAKNVITRIACVHIGTLTMSIVGAREVFREAIHEGASSIIVAHNHPSGDPTPSPEDIEVTKKLVDIGVLLDIPVLDHVVLGEKRYVSLAEKGLL